MPDEKEHRRHLRWYALARKLCPLILRKYTFTYTSGRMGAFAEPTIVLSNHLTESDMFMVGSAFDDHLYYVCGEHLLRSKIGPFLRYIEDPISAPRGGGKIQTVAQILRRVKQGYNVAMFPEGCRSFNGETLPTGSATAKLVKRSGAALVTYRIHGGYFIAPRWAYFFRKGHAEGEIVHTYSSEDLKKMTVAELTGAINRDLYENAYDYQRVKKIPYRSKKAAEGLENYLIICPECGKYDTMITHENTFRCSSCGLGGIYDEYGSLQGDRLPFHTVYDWGKWMEGRFREDYDAADRDLLFEEQDITLYEIQDGHKRKDLAGKGSLKIFRDRMEYTAGDLARTFRYAEIPEKSLLYYGKTFLFTDPTGYFGLTGEAFHAWKLDKIYDYARE